MERGESADTPLPTPGLNREENGLVHNYRARGRCMKIHGDYGAIYSSFSI